MYGAVWGCLFVIEIFECLVKIDEDRWMYDNIMFEEVDMNEQNEDKTHANKEHVDCSDTFNTSQVLI